MNELNNLIDKALEKANQDLNNEKVEVNYTPEFLIELLEEIKKVANPKRNGNVYEIKKQWSTITNKYMYHLHINNVFYLAYHTKEEACKKIASREEVANV